ncbi:hypothetical protein HOC80_02915 [archaeon]|jgi:hypothetical protein|nr:hypothetical protein [archaeon]MBT4417030.1 hypothetical protein [archaeon]
MKLNKIWDIIVRPKRYLTLLDVVIAEEETEIVYLDAVIDSSGWTYTGSYDRLKTLGRKGYLLVSDQERTIQVNFYLTKNKNVNLVHNPEFLRDEELENLIEKDEPTVAVRYKKITARGLVNKILYQEKK